MTDNRAGVLLCLPQIRTLLEGAVDEVRRRVCNANAMPWSAEAMLAAASWVSCCGPGWQLLLAYVGRLWKVYFVAVLGISALILFASFAAVIFPPSPSSLPPTIRR